MDTSREIEQLTELLKNGLVLEEEYNIRLLAIHASAKQAPSKNISGVEVCS